MDTQLQLAKPKLLPFGDLPVGSLFLHTHQPLTTAELMVKVPPCVSWSNHQLEVKTAVAEAQLKEPNVPAPDRKGPSLCNTMHLNHGGYFTQTGDLVNVLVLEVGQARVVYEDDSK